VPHFGEAHRLPAEDVLGLEASSASTLQKSAGRRVRIVVPVLPRIANFDDLDPLKLEPDVDVQIVQPGSALPVCDLVIIPGSKSTVSDLAAMRREGWDIDIHAHARCGGAVLGLCGGYQMLGKAIHDPQGLEGTPGSFPGLGLLEVETTLVADKTLTLANAVHAATGTTMTGYEIHLGKTQGPDCSRPFAHIDGRLDGAHSANGRIMGSYSHGCFSSDEFRSAFLKSLCAEPSQLKFESVVEATLDELAAHLEKHIDIAKLLPIAQPVSL